MPKASPAQRAFNAGEWSSLLYGRTDHEKYGHAMAHCENFIPTVQGPLVRRSGFLHVCPVKDSSAQTRLIPFEFSTTQAYMLEFGDGYIRFYKDNGNILETGLNISAITKANPGVLTYSGTDPSNGDWFYIESVGGMTELNGRFVVVANVNAGSNTFELTDHLGNNIDTTNYTTYTSGGTISRVYTITSPYGTADLDGLKFTQSADVLYLTHPDYAPRTLTRTAHTSWTLATMEFDDGPYLNINTTTTTLTPDTAAHSSPVNITNAADNGSGLIRITAASHGLVTDDCTEIEGVTGTTEANEHWIITRIDANTFDLQGSTFTNAYVSGGTTTRHPLITASAVTGINDDTGFQATDVNRVLRMKEGSTWGWGYIVHVFSTTKVAVHVGSTFTNTNAKVDWRLGVWSGTSGYPACVMFYEDRLFFGGATDNPQRIDGSNTSDYPNFAPSELDGTIADSHAVSFTLASNDVNVIRWMIDDEKGLLIGTAGGEWILRPSSLSEALSATNVTAKRSTGYGSADIAAIRAGRNAIYVQSRGRKLRELAYIYEIDGFKSPDLTMFSEHITLGGVTAISYQQEPFSIVWAIRADGQLLGLTFEKDQQVLGWHRHIVGGSFGNGDSVVESIATIPSPDGTRDELWAIIKRTINGNTVRYIEYMNKIWESGDTLTDGVFLDSALTYSGGATTTLSGLWHLEGEDVSVLVNGSTHPDVTVASGSVTLSRSATSAVIGYPYDSDVQTLNIEAGAADGTAQSKTKRIHRVAFRFNDTVGCEVGPSSANLKEIPFRSSASLMDNATDLFTGDKTIEWNAGYEIEGKVYLRQSQPLPLTLVAIYPQVFTQDRG